MKIEMKMTPDQVDSLIKLAIALTFCFTVLVMVVLSMLSLVGIQQPMNGIAPADKQFFFLLSDMSKYILGSLGTLLAIKGKEKIDEWKGQGAGRPEPEPEAPAPASVTTEETTEETKGVTP
jgi:hypothetical protein